MEKETMLGKVMEKIIGLPLAALKVLYDLTEKIAGSNGVFWLKALKKFLRQENPFDLESPGDWEAFYKKFFGKDYNFSNLAIPEKPADGRWRLLIIVDISLEALYAKCKELFPCWRWTTDDLDEIVTENERDAKNGAYAIWVKDAVEADEELKNFSANDIKDKSITTETLAERLIHELKFFDETGNHLDINNVTLCAGSRCSDGDVPDVSWNDDKLHVYCYYPGNSYPNLRSRQAVS